MTLIVSSIHFHFDTVCVKPINELRDFTSLKGNDSETVCSCTLNKSVSLHSRVHVWDNWEEGHSEKEKIKRESERQKQWALLLNNLINVDVFQF